MEEKSEKEFVPPKSVGDLVFDEEGRLDPEQLKYLRDLAEEGRLMSVSGKLIDQIYRRVESVE